MSSITEIPERAAILLRAELLVHASPERVWQVLTDMERWGQWHRGVNFAALRGELRSGARLDWHADGMRLRSTLTEVDEPRHLGWVSRAMGAGGVHRWTLEPHGTDSTLVRSEEAWDGLLVSLLRRTLRRTLERSRTHWLEGLKARAEGMGREMGS